MNSTRTPHSLFPYTGRRRLAAALCALALVFLFTASWAFADGGAETAVISNPNPADRLNLRSLPAKDGASLGKYYNGVEVEVLEHTSADWVKVRIGTDPGSAEGYMMTQYLAFGAAKAAVKSAIPVFTATAASWGILTDPLPANNFVGNYGPGVHAELLGFSPGWWHLRVNGQTGYIMAEQQVLQAVDGTYYDGFDTAIVNNPNPADRLYLRKDPSEDSASLGKYYNGVTAAILREVDTEWLKVRIGTREGYMARDYLLCYANPGSVASAMPTVTINLSASRLLNLREKPSISSKSMGQCYGGTKVQVLGLTEGWYHVQAGNQIGFMMAKYLTPQLAYGSSNGIPATPAPPTAAPPAAAGSSVWGGPVGNHATAAWPIPILDRTAIVNNPDPRDRLHLRTGPGQEYPSLGKYYNGVTVVINSDLSGEWTFVIIGNLSGYMKTEYLSIGTASAPASAMPVMKVSNPNRTANLHLREDPTTDSVSLGLYPNGTKVVLMGFSDTWAHVIVNGEMGFMLGKYLK